jgi:hypothetical protein
MKKQQQQFWYSHVGANPYLVQINCTGCGKYGVVSNKRAREVWERAHLLLSSTFGKQLANDREYET